MIEIAFDETTEATYKGKKYPQIDVPDFLSAEIFSYVDFALQTLKTYKDSAYLIVWRDDARFSFQKLGLAFFVASCFVKSPLECLVFKVHDQKKSFEEYRPCVAASIGIKYALRLCDLSSFEIFKELRCLNYLNFSLKENYRDNSIVYQMGEPELSESIETHTTFDAVFYVSLLKIFSLAGILKNINLKVRILKESAKNDKQKMVERLLKSFTEFGLLN